MTDLQSLVREWEEWSDDAESAAVDLAMRDDPAGAAANINLSAAFRTCAQQLREALEVEHEHEA